MTFNEIFQQYYTLYRAEAEAPDSSDDEYRIGMRFANDAIRRWASYDNTFWKELHTNTALLDDGAELTTSAGQTTYALPDSFKQMGSYVKLLNADGTTNGRIPLLDPQERQFRGDASRFVWVSGSRTEGYSLVFNVAPEAGLTIFYDYYKEPELITSGTSEPEMSNPDFMIDHMLANRYRASRNPYYGTAKRDAENKLGQMKLENESGTWANPATIPDRSGSIWGGGDLNNPWSW